jgi:hypothetical protein
VLGARSGRDRSGVRMSLTIEAMMLFKIKAVRRDLRISSGPARFLILLNLNKLSDCGGERDSCMIRTATFKAGTLLKANEA